MMSEPRANDNLVLTVPPQAPSTKPGPVARAIARGILRVGGWRMVGAIPDVPKAIMICAPHSSNWDGLWAFAAKIAMGLDVRIFAKHQLFWWPLGPILHRLRVIKVNRDAAHGLIGQVTRRFNEETQLWVGIAPEGTRSKVERWKPGFWKIAKAANVPVIPAYFHYPEKIIGIGEAFALSDDMDADIARIRAWYAPWRGKHRGV
jgi:1-acyl-sn-glycerol-3-phosphate acyltransferase